ncbi:MAG: DinB family protein [Mucilaginibacter sp.]|nr:DinB family protein [Mucilaginibacter sp.]
MKKLSLLFTLLVMAFASSSVYAQFTQGQMVDEWQRAKAYTKDYLDAMPADGYGFKPTPEIRSFAQQMLHLADANYFFITSATGQPSPMGKKSVEASVAPTKEATTRSVMDSYDFVIKSLQGMTTAQLQESAKLEGHEMSKSGIFGKAFEHQTHHRGQTTIYLRLKGVKPPQERLF